VSVDVPIAVGEGVVLREVVPVGTGTVVIMIVVPYVTGTFADGTLSSVVDVHPTKTTAAMIIMPKAALYVSDIRSLL
jgi:hypothetical protein